jgi:hypothetical protein
MSYFFKTIVKDSEKYKKGVIKLKIIKTIKFESILLENNKQININDVLKDWWVKILLEIHSIIINNENKTFYLFLRPHVFSFKDKQIKSNYNFLEDSDSNEEIPDSDIHNLFLKQTKNNKSNEKQTSSQINYNLKQLDLMSKNNLSLTSSENKILDSKESSTESEKETLKKSDSEEKSLSDSKKENLSDSKKESLSDSEEDSLSDSEEDSLTESEEESLKKLSDFEDTSSESEEETLKKISESEEESLKKLSDFEETSSESEEETLKKISESEEETLKKLSDSEEESIKKKENDNLQNSITLTALLERDNFK